MVEWTDTSSMSRRKVEHFEDIQSVKDAVYWLKHTDKTGGEVEREQGAKLAEEFPDDFIFEDRFWAEDDGYAQDLLAISNWRSWQREYKDTEGKIWWRTPGPGVLALKRTKDGDTSEGEALDGLDGYPVFDESDHSDLEMETQSNDWEEYGRDDFKREIKENANEADSDVIEELVDQLSDDEVYEFAHERWEDTGHYPEIEGTGTYFPHVLEDWDGSLLEFGEMFNLAEKGYVVEATLSPAAFHHGRIVLRKQDLPKEVQALVNNPAPMEIKYDRDICDSPYISCRWTSKKEIEKRKEDIETGQLALPGVRERKQRRVS